MDEETQGKLIIELKNIKPLELIEMAQCLLSAGAEYQRYLAEHEGDAASEDVRLLVREVRKGSAVFEIVAGCWGVFPYAFDYGKTLLGFIIELKKSISYLKKESMTDGPVVLTKPTLERINRLVQPTANDSPGAVFNIFYAENGGKIADSLTINTLEANAIQNTARAEIEKLKEPVAGYHDGAVLYFFQTRDDTRSDTGDKAIIERLSKSPVKTKFATEEAKAKVLALKGNIFHHAFVVDVRVETISDKPVLYTILRVHESIPRPKQGDFPLLD